MKKLGLFLILFVFVLGSCDKGGMNDDKSLNTVAAIKHNSYVLLHSDIDHSGTPLVAVAKNGILQSESMARLFCKEILFELTAGQTINSGNVIIANDINNLYVTYKAGNGWKINEIHLYAGTFQNIPANNQGVPVPGQFPIKETFDPAVETVTYEIPLTELPDCPYVLAHAVVTKDGQEETAWGKGDLSFEDAFQISRWGWVMQFCPEKCEGKDLIVGSKSYLVDPEIFNVEQNNYSSWMVSKGEGSATNCLGLGFNTFNTLESDPLVFDLMKKGDAANKAGTMTVSISVENNVKYINVVINDLDDLSLFKTYLYVGTEDGLKVYNYTEANSMNCYEFYNWFFHKEEISKTHTFKIPLSEI